MARDRRWRSALKPKLLLLDEPTAGMSPEETYKTGELIKSLKREGMTVLVVEHDMAFVRQIAQRVTVLHLGEIFARRQPREISDDEGRGNLLGKDHMATEPLLDVRDFAPATAPRRSCRASTCGRAAARSSP